MQIQTFSVQIVRRILLDFQHNPKNRNYQKYYE